MSTHINGLDLSVVVSTDPDGVVWLRTAFGSVSLTLDAGQRDELRRALNRVDAMERAA